MDYRVVDAITDPPGRADLHHAETLVRLPGCFLCYSPLLESPPIEPSPRLKNGFVTFANFNMAAKMEDAWFARVAAILHSVPESRLVLKSETFIASDDASSSWIFERFAAHGIGQDRLRVLSRTDSQKEHLALYAQADIALDTFPYNGTTTTCEALWMGVPVVTLAGETHVSRVGLSLLTAIGLPELAASTPERFIQIACELAEQTELLGQWRQTMRERMKPIMDGAAFARKLEHAYQGMVENNAKK
jgi:predicted O-linked N-acetylglucosamine transferase (SPINDLY family)